GFGGLRARCWARRFSSATNHASASALRFRSHPTKILELLPRLRLSPPSSSGGRKTKHSLELWKLLIDELESITSVSDCIVRLRRQKNSTRVQTSRKTSSHQLGFRL